MPHLPLRHRPAPPPPSLKPYFRETLTESRKVAELLSYVPQLDTLALMQAAAGMQADGGVSGLARTSSQISDASDA